MELEQNLRKAIDILTQWQRYVKLGQWVTSLESHSISFRPISRGRKLDSSVQHDFSSFRSWLSMTWWSRILKNILAQWFGIPAQRNINNNRKTEEFLGESQAAHINPVSVTTPIWCQVSVEDPTPSLHEMPYKTLIEINIYIFLSE